MTAITRSAPDARRRTVAKRFGEPAARASPLPEREFRRRLLAAASTHCGQRGANEQPGGNADEIRRLALDRGQPLAVSLMRGIEFSSASV